MFHEINSSKTNIVPSCIPHGLLFIVFLAVDLQVVVVNSNPLNIPNQTTRTEPEEHPSSQHPFIEGLFGVHALNISSSETQQSHGDGVVTSQRETPDTDETPVDDPDKTTTQDELGDDLTLTTQANNETAADASDQDKDTANIVTSPHIEVLSKTIIGTNQAIVSDIENGIENVVLPSLGNEIVDDKVDVTGAKQKQEGQPLESGVENSTVETSAEVDIFDNLMSSINGHWTDFVAKMKLSVLDVWRSISSHMMDRLENFASAL